MSNGRPIIETETGAFREKLEVLLAMAAKGAAEINYRGMKPSNVGGLVAEACRA